MIHLPTFSDVLCCSGGIPKKHNPVSNDVNKRNTAKAACVSPEAPGGKNVPIIADVTLLHAASPIPHAAATPYLGRDGGGDVHPERFSIKFTIKTVHSV